MVSLNNRSILVTGGTGTFGHAFIRHILGHHSPRRLIVFSRDEYKQWEMRREFGNAEPMRYFIGDVRDLDRLKMAFRVADIVVHAAALKHIASGEINPIEVIKTNVMGAQNVIQAAIDCGVEKVVALSTDKAVNPINLYGASKLCAEKLFVSANVLSGADGTQFSVVRYGNVINSRGSVIELFKNQALTGKITLTDRRMTRFFMKVEQAVHLVLNTLDLMQGGEVIVPKIPSVKIVDLAEHFARGQCEYETIGIRPGEKLHETLISSEEARDTFALTDLYKIVPDADWYMRSHATGLVESGFSYRSDTNSWQISGETLSQLIE